MDDASLLALFFAAQDACEAGGTPGRHETAGSSLALNPGSRRIVSSIPRNYIF